MKWKQFPYWLKGGMIGGGVTLVSVILFYSCVLFVAGRQVNFVCLPFLFVSPMFPFIDLFDNNPFLRTLPRFSFEVLGIIIWFIIGALIGAFVDYIKSKKKNMQ